MLNQLLNLISSRGGFCKALTRLHPVFDVLGLTVLLFFGGLQSAQAQNSQVSSQHTPFENNTLIAQHQFLDDGVYLYGESPQPEQIGQAYMVFEVTQGQLTGAFYMPRSSFDCFSGVAQGNQLNLNITESYSQQTYSHTVGFNNSSVVAAVGRQGADKNNLTLDGFHRLPNLSANDQRILNECKKIKN